MAHQGNHIGTLIKPHGYKGELLLKGKPQFLEELIPGIPLFIELSEQRIPFFIEKISLDASGEKCIIKFEFIDSDMDARRYVNCEVFQELQSKQEPVSTEISSYIGCIVIDTLTGDELTVTDFYDSPENPILILEKDGVEVMLPAKADYILSIDIPGKIIKAEFPEGLML